ncbi:MAG: cadherin domain-containing protein [Anaerolineales bacterium]|nr:cadherin domain-containing protein [Anaerolineales bacterium]
MSKRFGNYLIKGTIATTSQATLFLAHDLRHGQEVVLKVFDPKLYADAVARERLLSNCEMVKNLPPHLNLLPIIEIGQDNFDDDANTTYVYVTMPYRSDGTVRDYLNWHQRQQQSLPLPLVLQWVAELADALAHVHAHGLRHGDVKAENVLLEATSDLDYPYRPQLADFILMRGTGTHPIGSFPYMSPEQVRGEELDGRSDLYALGVLLYLLLAGQFPFDIKKPADVAQHLYAPFESPRTAPPQVQAIVAKAMSREKNGRYATASDMVADLRQAIATLHPTTPPIPPPAAELSLVPTELSGLDNLTAINVGQRLDMHTTWEAPSEYRLIVSHQYDGDRVYYLRQGYVRLGRDPQHNDIVLPDVHVSRQHAILERIPKRQWQILHLKGANKLFLNGKDRSEQTEAIAWSASETLRIGPYFLRWQDVALINGAIDEEPDDLEATPPPDEALLTVTVEPEGEVITIAPDATVPLKVTLHNRSETTNHYRLEFVGAEQLPLRWQNPAQPLPLNADEQGMQEIRLTTFPNSAATAGRYPCQLRVYGANTGGLLLERPLTIEIPAFDQLAVDMHPSRIRHGDATQIRLENRGNTPQTYRLLARDQADELLFYPHPDRRVVVPNGATVTESLEVRGKKRPWLGRPKTIPFQVQLTSNNQTEQAASIQGELEMAPRISNGVFTFFAFMLVLFGLLGYFAFTQVQANAQERVSEANAREATAVAVAASANIRATAAAEQVAQAKTEEEKALALAEQASAQAALDTANIALTQAARDAAAVRTAVPDVVQPENNDPSAITLNGNTVAENKPSGTFVGTLHTQDADVQDIHLYSLSCDQPGPDDSAFQIVGEQLLTAKAFDYESQNSYTICIKSDDLKGGSTTQPFTIQITDANDKPTELQLDRKTVDENAANGTIIGTLTTKDADQRDSHLYSLVPGSGSDDNTAFFIDGTNLKVSSPPDFETKASYKIRIQTRDQAGEPFEQKFTIEVVDLNEPPKDIALTPAQPKIKENQPLGTVVGKVTVVGDPDSKDQGADAHMLSITEGGEFFELEGNTIKTKISFDFENSTHKLLKVTVQANSAGEGGAFSKSFSVETENVNEPPTTITLKDQQSIEENVSEAVIVGTLVISGDPDEAALQQPYTVSVLLPDQFEIVDLQLRKKSNTSFNYESQQSINVTVTVTDGELDPLRQTFTIQISDANDPPDIATNNDLLIHVSQAELEDSSFSFPVAQIHTGLLQAKDEDNGEDLAGITYTITNNPGKGKLSTDIDPPSNDLGSFKQKDIKAKPNDGSIDGLRYVRGIPSTSASKHTSANDSFKFTLSDDGNASNNLEYTFTITVNVRPEVTTNTGLTIGVDASEAQVTEDVLKTEDEVDADVGDKSMSGQITYVVVTVPTSTRANGNQLVRKEGSKATPLSQGSTFTQKDIEDSKLFFQRNITGDATDVSFTFKVHDKYSDLGKEGWANQSGGENPEIYTFVIVIGAKDAVASPLTVKPNSTATISTANLTTIISDTQASLVNFGVVALTGGELSKNKTFSQQDIIDNDLTYTSPDQEGIQCLYFTVTTQEGTAQALESNILYTLKFVVDDGNEPAINADGDCPALPAQAASQQNRLVASVYPFRGMVY